MKKTITQLVNENLFGGTGSPENVDLFAKRIIRGIYNLDMHLDGWYNKIDLVNFDVMNNALCICGQLEISGNDLVFWINEADRWVFYWDQEADITNTLKLHEQFGFYIEFSDRRNMAMKDAPNGLNYIWITIIKNFKECTDLISFE